MKVRFRVGETVVGTEDEQGEITFDSPYLDYGEENDGNVDY